MNKRLDKKGQFYLVAAVIIVVALFALIGVTNYVSTRKSTHIHDLVEDLSLEAENVVEHGAVNKNNLDAQLQEFASQFTNLEDNYNYFFFYGDKKTIEEDNKITLYSVEKVSAGGQSLRFASKPIEWEFNQNKVSIDELDITLERFSSSSNDLDKIIVTLKDDTKYEIEVNEGENFYLIIKSSEVLEGEEDEIQSSVAEENTEESTEGGSTLE